MLDRIAVLEVDRRRAELARLIEPLRDAIDDVHLGGASQQRAVGGEQPDRPGAEHGHRAARLDQRQLGRVPAGDERIRQQQEVVLALVARLAREQHAVGVRERDAQELGLGAPIGHSRVAVRGAAAAGVHAETGCGVPAAAVEAEPAEDVRWNHDAVALLDHADTLAGLLDDPERLVADHEPRLGPGAPVEHVQVAAADRARRQSHDHVGRLLDHGVLHLMDAYPPGVLVDDSLHAAQSARGAPSGCAAA